MGWKSIRTYSRRYDEGFEEMIKNFIKASIRQVILAAGFDLHRLSPASNPAFQLLKALNRFEVDLVLDVGANVG